MKPLPRQFSPARSAAYTITEMLIATGVFGVIAVICLTCFSRLQRFHALALARSGIRTEVVRLSNAMEVDLRSARALTCAVSGSENVLPLTLTVPQRYVSFETSSAMAGDPGRSTTRIQPTVNTTSGKLTISNDVTVSYATVANGTTAQDIQRTMTWTESGVQKTATRTIATLPSTAIVRFRSGASSSSSPAPIATTDISLVARFNAPLALAQVTGTASVAMESTIFLRRKSLK